MKKVNNKKEKNKIIKPNKKINLLKIQTDNLL